MTDPIELTMDSDIERFAVSMLQVTRIHKDQNRQTEYLQGGSYECQSFCALSSDNVVYGELEDMNIPASPLTTWRRWTEPHLSYANDCQSKGATNFDSRSLVRRSYRLRADFCITFLLPRYSTVGTYCKEFSSCELNIHSKTCCQSRYLCSAI